MSLLQLVRVQLGEVGVVPGEVKMLTTDDLATITTQGYLNGAGTQVSLVQLSPLDIVECMYSYNSSTGTASYVTLTVSVSGGLITLAPSTDLNSLLNGRIFVGNASNVATAVLMSGDATLANTGALTIANSAITNVKVSASAAIAYSKLAALTSGNILVGSVGNVATSVAMSGDATIVASGALTIAANAVTTAKILDANVTLAKLAAGITPSHVVKFAGQPTTVGGAAAEAFVVTGAAATDLAFVQIVNNGAANVTVLEAVVTLNTLTVTFSADPSNDVVINYQLLRAAS